MSVSLFSVLLLGAIASVTCDGVSFLTLGDWGGAALDAGAAANQNGVAAQMATTAAATNAQFVLNTGDNFYWCGIQNTSDYQVSVDFVDVYSQESLQVPWYGILGNHEYGYNVTALLSLSEEREDMENWYLPSRYYTKRIHLAGTHFMSVIMMDTSPCVSDYRSSNEEYWDPCGTEYPTCSLGATDDDFEGECMFHSNIIEQNCTQQYEWLQGALAEVPTNDWLVIMGHHPADEIDEEPFLDVLLEHGFDMYLNGHVHALQQYTIDNGGAYFTSGAGSLAASSDQETPMAYAKLDKRDEDINKLLKEKAARRSEQLLSAHDGQFGNGLTSTHTYQSLYSTKTNGFLLHTFSDDYSTLETQFISASGTVLRTYTISKGQYKNTKKE
jgi:tartrate-resistant acid phosphatase type 5